MQDNPMHHPEEQPTGSDATPKFGRLLLVLLCAVLAIGILTLASVRFYT